MTKAPDISFLFRRLGRFLNGERLVLHLRNGPASSLFIGFCFSHNRRQAYNGITGQTNNFSHS